MIYTASTRSGDVADSCSLDGAVRQLARSWRIPHVKLHTVQVQDWWLVLTASGVTAGWVTVGWP